MPTVSLPCYSVACSAVIWSSATRLTHPVTGEKYGGTDWTNDAKLAEVDTVPMEIVDANDSTGRVLSSEVVTLNEAQTAATLTRTWRDKTDAEVDEEVKGALSGTDLASARKVEDLWVLLLEKELIAESDVPAAVADWIASRTALRADL